MHAKMFLQICVRFYFELFANALMETSAQHDIRAKSTDETIVKHKLSKKWLAMIKKSPVLYYTGQRYIGTFFFQFTNQERLGILFITIL